MARQFDPIPLDYPYPPHLVEGKCDQCGDGAHDDEIRANPTLYRVEIVGLVRDPYGCAGEGRGFICRRCYERSKEREYVIFTAYGDVMAEGFASLEDAMKEITTYLENPYEYRSHAPFRIEARNEEFALCTAIATIGLEV